MFSPNINHSAGCNRITVPSCCFFSHIVSELFNAVALETGVISCRRKGRSFKYKAAEHRRCGWVGLNTRGLMPGFGRRDDSSRSVRKAGRVMPRHLAPLHTCVWDTVRKSNRRESEAHPHYPHLLLHRAPLFGLWAELQEKISDMNHVREVGGGRHVGGVSVSVQTRPLTHTCTWKLTNNPELTLSSVLWFMLRQVGLQVLGGRGLKKKKGVMWSVTPVLVNSELDTSPFVKRPHFGRQTCFS